MKYRPSIVPIAECYATPFGQADEDCGFDLLLAGAATPQPAIDQVVVPRLGTRLTRPLG